jgi:uncharacterized protein (DUF2267 family)
MALTGLKALDSTVEKTNLWLKDIMQELGTDDRHRAYLALSAVLHALRDRLPVIEAAHLSAQLPMLIRGIYFDGWDPSHEPIKLDRNSFLQYVRDYFRSEPGLDAEIVVRAVFKVISQRIGSGEINEVKNILPKDLRQLWEPSRVQA